MKKNYNGYKYCSIRELIFTLQEMVKDSETLTLDSPVMISDFNMSGYKEEFSVLPTFSTNQGQAGVCLFHSLKGTVQSAKPEEKVEEKIDCKKIDYENNEVDVEDDYTLSSYKPNKLTNTDEEDSLMSFIEKYRG